MTHKYTKIHLSAPEV